MEQYSSVVVIDPLMYGTDLYNQLATVLSSSRFSEERKSSLSSGNGGDTAPELIDSLHMCVVSIFPLPVHSKDEDVDGAEPKAEEPRFISSQTVKWGKSGLALMSQVQVWDTSAISAAHSLAREHFGLMKVTLYLLIIRKKKKNKKDTGEASKSKDFSEFPCLTQCHQHLLPDPGGDGSLNLSLVNMKSGNLDERNLQSLVSSCRCVHRLIELDTQDTAKLVHNSLRSDDSPHIRTFLYSKYGAKGTLTHALTLRGGELYLHCLYHKPPTPWINLRSEATALRAPSPTSTSEKTQQASLKKSLLSLIRRHTLTHSKVSESGTSKALCIDPNAPSEMMTASLEVATRPVDHPAVDALLSR